MSGRISRRQALQWGVGTMIGGAAVALGGGTSEARPAARTWWGAPRAIPTSATADGIAAALSGRRAPFQAGDVPHVYPLVGDEVLWILNDSFLSDRPDGPIDDRSQFVRNLALHQRGDAVTVLDRGGSSFVDEGERRYDRWWWCHGGEVDGALLHVVTTEMVRTGAPGWAINFEPVRTWITTIAWRTRSVLRMRPAPNDGVLPVYGFSVTSDERWTYLYGNNHLYGRGTTENRVARVPRGQLLDRPAYWDGDRWVGDSAAAVSIHTAGELACRLHVAHAAGIWWAASKDEEFFGDHVTIRRADSPTGPFEEVASLAVPTATGDGRSCTYDAMVHPLDDGRLLVWWSNNGFAEAEVRADPRIYRPTFRIVDPL